MQLRPYQTDAVSAVWEDLEDQSSTMVVMPTGCGKTVVIAFLVKKWLEAGRGKVLLVAHRDMLISQLIETSARVCGLSALEVGVEMASERAAFHHRVVAATVQTMGGNRLRNWDPEHFSLIVVDEAHHAPAKSYTEIVKHFGKAKVFGVTATAERMDRQSLMSTFGYPSYVYDLHDAIDDGWLVPISCRRVKLGSIDLDGVKVVAGDFQRSALGDVMNMDANLNGVVKATLDNAGERPTLVFGVDVRHARLLARMFRSYGADAVSVDGGMRRTEREAVLDGFRNGKHRILVNCLIMTEGVDIPRIACVSMARPTKSRGLYTQMIGRGFRLLGGSMEESAQNGKKDLLVIDFVDNSEENQLVSALEIFEQAELNAEVQKAAKKLLQERTMGISEALRRAEIAAAQIRVAKAVKYKSLGVLSTTDLLGIRKRAAQWKNDDTVTEAQKAVLDRHRVTDVTSRREASQVISAIVERSRRDLCTLPMKVCLLRAGLWKAGDLSYEEAKELIGKLANNGWRPTLEMLEKYGAAFEGDDPEADSIVKAALRDIEQPAQPETAAAT